MVRSLHRALVLLGVAVVLLCSIELALALPNADPWWPAVLFASACWVYLAAGVLAWWRRPANGLGALIVVGGLALFANGLTETGVPVLVAFGTVLATSSLAVIFHLLHAFPSGHLRGRASRLTVVGGYFVSLVLQAPLYLFNGTGRVPSMLVMADRPDLLAAGHWVQRGGGVVVTVATAVILLGRLFGAGAAHRRVLAPLFAYGIFTVVFIPVSANVLAPLIGWSPEVRGAAQVVVVAGIPIAFALGVLRGGFARTGQLEELGTWLGSAGAARPALTGALARTLGDPSLRVVFWAPDRGVYLDADGALTKLPPRSSDRAAVDIELEGRRVGAIDYDAVLVDDLDLVRTAGQVVAIAVDRERLTAELLASQDALRRSRARLVETADRERRRIAQDLHDGLQVQLVLLALQAQQVANALGTSEHTRTRATALRQGIDAAAADLRQLVHAVMPASLVERGLSAATEDLVDRMPVPTRLELGIVDGALPPSVESTAYFVVAEGLTNAVKHAEAGALSVRLVREGDCLLVEVDDDGVGGAAMNDGAGLRGLADRVDVIGGRLRVHSEAHVGTQLRAELPCGS